MMRRRYQNIIFMGLILLLSGCTKPHPIVYSPNNFINPNRIVTQKAALHLPPAKVKATFGYGNDPSVIKAYEQFNKKGIVHNVTSDTLRTIAYDAYAHPILACSPLHLCVVQLEQGERINDIELGDASHWIWARSRVGTIDNGSDQVSVKPKLYNLATDLLITTNKRTYNIGLVSKAGLPTQILTFYYPQETRQDSVDQWHHIQSDQHSIIFASKATDINLDQLHFDYEITGNAPIWKPLRIFDNGNKTFIEMPPLSAHFDLPVLYLRRHHQMQLVNYRYHRPYYIIDGLFQTAYLISGNGAHQERVIIYNRNFK